MGQDISLTYNRADNFRPTGQRYDMSNNFLAPEVGETEQHGILLSTFNRRLVLRPTVTKRLAPARASR